MQDDIKKYLEILEKKDKFSFYNLKTLMIFFRNLVLNNEFYQLYDEGLKIQSSNYQYEEYSADYIFNDCVDYFKTISLKFSDMLKFYINETDKIIYAESIEKSQFLLLGDKEKKKATDFKITIPKTGTLKDCFHLIHEFTHLLAFKINELFDLDKPLINIFDEALAIYSELLFCKYIKNDKNCEDLRKIILERIYGGFHQGYPIYCVYNVIEQVKAGKSNDEIRQFIDDEIFLEEFYKKVKSEDVYTCSHFVGIVIAFNLYNNNINLEDVILTINKENCKDLKDIMTNFSFDSVKTTNLIQKFMNSIFNKSNIVEEKRNVNE